MGPSEPASLGGSRYVCTFTCDHTRYVWVYFLKSKDQTLKTFWSFKTMVENLTGKQIKFFHSDRGGEFTSKEFDKFLAKEGVIHKTSLPKTPQQNGVAKRMNQTLLGGARAMLEHSGMTKGFWAEALRTTAHIANRCPCKGLGWWTPFELLFGRTPDVSYFWIFGCRAWKFNEDAKKRDPKALPMVLIGYEPGSKAYRLWDTKSHKIVVSASVWFTETELLYQPPKPAPPAPTPKPPVPSSSKVKLPDLSSIPWSFFNDSDEDSPKPKPSHPPKSPTPNGPVRNMVFFELFLVVFHDLLCCFTPSHSFLSVSLLKKRQYACY